MANPELSYPYEKFMVAIYCFASASDIRTRIYSAFTSFMTLKSSDFNAFPDIQSEFDDLKSALTKVKASGDEGNVQATLNAISDDEAAAIASKIVDIHLMISRARFG